MPLSELSSELRSFFSVKALAFLSFSITVLTAFCLYVLRPLILADVSVSGSSSSSSMYDTKDRSRLCPHPIQRDCSRRAVFVDYGCTLYSWPSSGGVIIKDNANGVEMVFLGLDRFNPPSERFEDAEAEDAFGRELRKIGGKRWKSEQRYLDAYFAEGNGTKLTEAELKVNIYGWPDNGGLWVLEYPKEEGVPNDIARLNMAFTMEERCQLLKEYNAKFYENPRDYGGLADVFTDEENQAEL